MSDLYERAYALRVEGDALRPRYRPRDYVVVLPDERAQPGEDVIVTRSDGSAALAQLESNGKARLLGQPGEQSLLSGVAIRTLQPVLCRMKDAAGWFPVAGCIRRGLVEWAAS